MTALIVLLWMMIGAVAGLVIGDVIAPAFGFRHMEGMSAYFGVFSPRRSARWEVPRSVSGWR